MTYRLYGSPGSRHMMTEMVLAHGGLDYDIELIDMKAGDHRTPEFLAINPMGWVPALVCPDGEVLFETPAIAMTIAERHGLDLVPPVGDPDRARFLGCLFNVTGELEPALKRVFYPARYALNEKKAPKVRDLAWDHVHERLDLIEGALGDGPYFLGQRFSLADMTLAYWMVYLDLIGTLPRFPKIRALYDAVRAQPSIAPLFEAFRNCAASRGWGRRTTD